MNIALSRLINQPAISGHEVSEPHVTNTCETEENRPLTASERKIISSVDICEGTNATMDGDEEIDTLGDPSKPYFSEDPGYLFFNLSNVYQAFQEGHKCIMVLGQRGDIQLPMDLLYL